MSPPLAFLRGDKVKGDSGLEIAFDKPEDEATMEIFGFGV